MPFVLTYPAVAPHVSTLLRLTSFVLGELCEITVTFWYLENNKGTRLWLFPLSFSLISQAYQHANASRRHCGLSNQTRGVQSVALCSLIKYQKRRNLLSRKACKDSHPKQRHKDTVQETVIESTALIMQICFNRTVITRDKAPQGVMTDVSL